MHSLALNRFCFNAEIGVPGKGTYQAVQLVNECIVGEVVSVGQLNAIFRAPELLHILYGDFGVEVLHYVAPVFIQLLTWLSDELIIFGRLRMIKECRLVLWASRVSIVSF